MDNSDIAAAPGAEGSPGRLVWITGLSGSGKTTLASSLHAAWPEDRKCVFLDGDALRAVLGPRKGHTRADRISLGLTYCRLADFLRQQGIDVILATVSMHHEVYSAVDALPETTMVYLATPLSECVRRDPKRLYSDYFTGKTSGVAGLDVEVDVPQGAHIVVHPCPETPETESVAVTVRRILRSLWTSP